MLAFFFGDDLGSYFFFISDFRAKRKKCHVHHVGFFDWNTFFQKNIKKKFAFHDGEGSKNYFFTLDECEPLIFFMFLPHLITRFVLKETKKRPGGGKLFSFFKGPKSLCPKFGIWNRGGLQTLG